MRQEGPRGRARATRQQRRRQTRCSVLPPRISPSQNSACIASPRPKTKPRAAFRPSSPSPGSRTRTPSPQPASDIPTSSPSAHPSATATNSTPRHLRCNPSPNPRDATPAARILPTGTTSRERQPRSSIAIPATPPSHPPRPRLEPTSTEQESHTLVLPTCQDVSRTRSRTAARRRRWMLRRAIEVCRSRGRRARGRRRGSRCRCRVCRISCGRRGGWGWGGGGAGG